MSTRWSKCWRRCPGYSESVFLLACVAAPRAPDPPSIILVSLDTLRADRLGALGNPDGLTPSLDRFAAESAVFTMAYSQSNLTTLSHASLFTSRYPSENATGSLDRAIPEGRPTLAGVLASYGYQTAAFVGGGGLTPALGVGVGFGIWRSPQDFGCLWHTLPEATAWLDDRDESRPFFAFIHGYDAHAPYLKPTPFGYAGLDASADSPGQMALRTDVGRVADGWLMPDPIPLLRAEGEFLRPRSPSGRLRVEDLAMARDSIPLTDADHELLRDVYDTGAAYADLEFGVLMAALDARHLLDEAVVVVVSDHGEDLGEEGLYSHCCDLHDAVTHVPILIRLPGEPRPGVVVDAPVGLIDLMPTLLDLVGAILPAGIHGRSLAPALRGEPWTGPEAAFSQGGERMDMVSVRTRAGRLTYTGIRATSPLLPELVSVAALDGPGFRASPPMMEAEAMGLRSQLVDWLRTLAPAPVERPADVPESLRATLRTHGYWGVDP